MSPETRIQPAHPHRLRTGALLISFLCVLLFGLAGAEESQPPPSALQDEDRKSMTRTTDFIVIHGKQLPGMLGKKINTLSLLSGIGDRVVPIPFQVDEINSEGEWILPEIPPEAGRRARRTEHDDDQGRLDENDQLVFMIRDSGDRIPVAAYPSEARTVEEITLTDSMGTGRSWVYLASFASRPPVSDRDYVSYRPDHNLLVSVNYELGFSKEVPISWSHLSFQGAPNMIDRLKIRFETKIFGIRYRRNETHFKSHISSYKDGNVRVIRRVRSSIKINRLLRTPSASSESIYYDNAIVIPFRAKVPVSLKSLMGIISDMKTRGGADMQNLHGWTLRVNTDERWLTVDGTMDETEQSVKGDGATWFVLSGPPGAYLCRIILDRKWDGTPQELLITTSFYYVDDDQAPDPPEHVPGQSPNVGFSMQGMEKLPKGTFYFYIIGYMIKDYREGVEQEYLDIMDRPVEVTVNSRDIS